MTQPEFLGGLSSSDLRQLAGAAQLREQREAEERIGDQAEQFDWQALRDSLPAGHPDKVIDTDPSTNGRVTARDRILSRLPTGPNGTQTNDDTSRAEDDMLTATIELALSRTVSGERFVFGSAGTVEAVWGRGDEVLWPKGEPFLLAGPSGVGKTTIEGQLIKARLEGGTVLGYPVEGDDRRVLLCAMDRPAQIARSLRRLFTDDDGALRRLVVWRGPLPFNIVKYPEGLAMLADQLGAGTVLVDSVKDLAPNISKEETGSQIDAAFQIATVAGIEVGAPHHQRKAQAENKKPTTLADVYGSQMLVNGAGSVVLLWGEAGDPVVELSHLKQPLEQVGPLTVVHDHATGISTADDRPDAFQLVQGANRGITAQVVAIRLYGKTEPTRNEVEMARRRLDGLVTKGLVHREQGSRGGVDGGQPTLYYPITGRPE